MTLCVTRRIARTHARRIQIDLREVSEPPPAIPFIGQSGNAGAFAHLLVEWKLAQLHSAEARATSA
jgi:hypothetical protein